MFPHWIILTFLLAMPAMAEESEAETPPERNWGLAFFTQALNSELVLKNDEDNRKIVLQPEPPGFVGIGASYHGIGASYQWTGTSREDQLKRSDAKGFKWTIPWKHFLFEYYNTEFEGSTVEGSAFRPDVESFNQGAIVTWSRKKDLDFSTIFGLENNLSKGPLPYKTHTFYTASVEETIWRGDTEFAPTVTGPTDFLGFRYLRRRFTKLGVGRTYVKYFKYVRFSALGSIGPFVGNRLLKYPSSSSLNNDEETEWGVAASLGFSLASDVGFRRLGKKWDANFNYGIVFYAHNASTVGSETIGTANSSASFYLGALF